MPQQDGFTGGLQFGLQVFNSLQNASYMQAQKEAMAENQEIRRQQLEVQQQQLDESQRQHAFQKTQLVLSNPDKFPQETVIGAYNTLNQMSGGRHNITKTDLDTFNTDMTKFISDVKGTSSPEEGEMMIQRYQERAATHPLLNDIFNRHLPIARDVIKRRGLYAAFDAAGVTDDRLKTKLTQDLTVDQAQDLLKDDKRMDLVRHQAAQQTFYRFQTDPDKVSDNDLLNALAVSRAQGQKPTAAGDAILKPRDMAAFHQEALSDLKQTKSDLGPLLDAEAAMTDEDRQSLRDAKNTVRTYAGTYDTGSGAMAGSGVFTVGAVKHSMDSVDAQQKVLGKYPALQQTLQQVGPVAIKKATMYQDQIDQWKRQRRLASLQAGPDTPATLERIDEKIAALETQAKPYQAIANYAKYPDSPEAMKGILGLRNTLGKAMEDSERKYNDFLTEAEKGARETREQQAKKIHVDTVGPAEVESAVMSEIAANPTMTDEQKMGRLAFHAQQYKAKTGYMPNINEASQRILPLRQKVENDTLNVVQPGQAEQIMNMRSGLDAVSDIEKNLFDSNGDMRYDELAKAKTGLPWASGRTLNAYIKQALDPIVRARTGAAIKDEEMPFYEEQFIPSVKDSTATAKAKLQRLKDYFGGTLNLVDPKGKLQERIKPQEKVAAATGNPPAAQSFADFKAYWQKNKDKFNGDMDAAAQAYRRGQ